MGGDRGDHRPGKRVGIVADRCRRVGVDRGMGRLERPQQSARFGSVQDPHREIGRLVGDRHTQRSGDTGSGRAATASASCEAADDSHGADAKPHRLAVDRVEHVDRSGMVGIGLGGSDEMEDDVRIRRRCRDQHRLAPRLTGGEFETVGDDVSGQLVVADARWRPDQCRTDDPADGRRRQSDDESELRLGHHSVVAFDSRIRPPWWIWLEGRRRSAAARIPMDQVLVVRRAMAWRRRMA